VIDYRAQTYQQILKRQLDRIPDTIDKREGSVIMTALGPESWYLEGLYLDLEKLQNNIYAPTAGGNYLDLIAEPLGIARKAAMLAVRKGSFNVAISIGKRFSTVAQGSAAAQTYTVTEYIGRADGYFVYRLTCDTPGEQGNGYVGQLLAIDYVQGLTDAQLGEIITPGTDEESDDAFRKRYLQKAQQPSTSGNENDYRNWATECSGVGAARVIPLAYGPGTVKVVIIDSNMRAATPALVTEVYDYIEGLRPIGATLTVVSAIEKAISVSAKVKLQNGVNLTDVQSMAVTTINEFLEMQAFDIDYISLARIGNLLLNVSGVEDYGELTLNGSTENITLSDEEVAVIEIVELGVM